MLDLKKKRRIYIYGKKRKHQSGNYLRTLKTADAIRFADLMLGIQHVFTLLASIALNPTQAPTSGFGHWEAHQIWTHMNTFFNDRLIHSKQKRVKFQLVYVGLVSPVGKINLLWGLVNLNRLRAVWWCQWPQIANKHAYSELRHSWLFLNSEISL